LRYRDKDSPLTLPEERSMQSTGYVKDLTEVCMLRISKVEEFAKYA